MWLVDTNKLDHVHRTPMVHFLLLLLFRNMLLCRLNTVATTVFFILAGIIHLDCQLFLWLFFVSCTSYINGVVPCFMYLSHKRWDVCIYSTCLIKGKMLDHHFLLKSDIICHREHCLCYRDQSYKCVQIFS